MRDAYCSGLTVEIALPLENLERPFVGDVLQGADAVGRVFSKLLPPDARDLGAALIRSEGAVRAAKAIEAYCGDSDCKVKLESDKDLRYRILLLLITITPKPRTAPMPVAMPQPTPAPPPPKKGFSRRNLKSISN